MSTHQESWSEKFDEEFIQPYDKLHVYLGGYRIPETLIFKLKSFIRTLLSTQQETVVREHTEAIIKIGEGLPRVLNPNKTLSSRVIDEAVGYNRAISDFITAIKQASNIWEE